MKSYRIIIGLICAFASISCNEWLDLKHESHIADKDFNKNKEELFASLTGCYNGLQGSLYREWAMSELRSDNTRIYASQSSSPIFDVIRQLDISTIQPINYLVDEYWVGCYQSIDRCNKVIRDFHVVDDAVVRAEYKAEALFLRAYQYFNLVRLYGGVCLVTAPITADEAQSTPRSLPEDIYNQIEMDLEEIVEGGMLPDTRVESELGRATMPAAKALLAKVYMTRYDVGSQEYEAARPLLKEVIETVGNPQSGGDLVPYNQIFDINNEMNKEIIFAVRYKAGNMGVGSPFANEFAPGNSGSYVVNGSGKSYNYPSTSIINAFAEGDLRKDISLAERYFNEGSNSWVEDDKTSQCRYVKKYLSPIQTPNDGESDWPIIRVADVLLLYAEILNEMEGPTATAINSVNIVRERAGIANLAEMQIANSYTFRKAIRAERRVELAFENQRWFDLLRWDIAVETITGYYQTEEIYSRLQNEYKPTIVDWQTILPIPFNVININPEMAQNAGY